MSRVLGDVFEISAAKPQVLISRMPDIRAIGVNDSDFPLTTKTGKQLVRMTGEVLEQFVLRFSGVIQFAHYRS